jgi:hypothetical protein
MKRIKLLGLAAGAIALAPLAAFAQTTMPAPQMPGLINVNLENVRVDIANGLDIDLEAVPINLQLPINVAANVCGVDIAALGTDANSCTATNSQLAMQYVTNDIDINSTASTTTDADAETEETAPAQ